MKCQNHPAANAAEQCASCDAPLCGMCCNFVDEGVFCERCLAALESKKKLEAEIKKREQPKSDIVYSDPDTEVTSKTDERSKDKMVVWAVVVAFVAIAAVQLFRYGNQGGAGLSPAEQARNQQLVSSIQCAAVFQQIGQLLTQDQEPPGELRCTEQQAAHVITRSGEEVRVAHPNPEELGFAEIWVSSSNPNPQMVRLAN